MSRYSVNTITRSPRRPARKPSSQPRSRVSLLSSAGVTFSVSSSRVPDQPLLFAQVVLGQVRRHARQRQLLGVVQVGSVQGRRRPGTAAGRPAAAGRVLDRRGPPGSRRGAAGSAAARGDWTAPACAALPGRKPGRGRSRCRAAPAAPACCGRAAAGGSPSPARSGDTTIGCGGWRRLIGCGGSPRATSSFSRRTTIRPDKLRVQPPVVGGQVRGQQLQQAGERFLVAVMRGGRQQDQLPAVVGQDPGQAAAVSGIRPALPGVTSGPRDAPRR